MTPHPCPTCGAPWDPVALLAARLQREDGFVKAYPRMHCPSCRKRVSPLFDNIDASGEQDEVAMDCRHCGNRWSVPRNEETRNE